MTSPFSTSAAELIEALATALPTGRSIEVGPPRLDADGLSLTLWTAVPGAPEPQKHRRRIPGQLTFVVSLNVSDADGLDLLHDLWLAVDASPFDLGSDSPSDQWWAGHGCSPQPHLTIHAQVVAERAIDLAPIVTEPLVLVNTNDVATQTLHGRVVGPGARPIDGARVVPVNSPALATTTDAAGGFVVRGVFDADRVDVDFTHHHLSARAAVPIDSPDFAIELSSSSS